MRKTVSTMAFATLFLLPMSATAADETGPAADLEKPPSVDLVQEAEDQLTALDPLQGAEEQAKYCDPECPEEPSPFTCQDFDGGNRPGTAGTLYFSYYGQVTGVYSDYCTSSTTLVEYWCETPSKWTTTSWLCGNGCSAGRCQ